MGGDFILRLANETLSNFNPLRPCGRRPESALKGSERAYFNPLRPCGRRLLGFKSQQLPAPFQSTPPVWAETFKDPLGVFKVAISIHSARVGGDLTCTLGWLASRYFNPLRPCGRRPIAFQVFLMIFGFQSTPPVWAETEYSAKFNAFIDISIHSARVGGDFLVEDFLKQSNDFNPLRPCGRRQTDCIAYIKTIIFQSTPPVWAETKLANLCGNLFNNFNPLRPCGRRRLAYCLMLFNFLFQSTPPVWAETPLNTLFTIYQLVISIHSARVGGDVFEHVVNVVYPDFNPLRPCGRRLDSYHKKVAF